MAGHYYLADGTCVEGLREARKRSAVPSPTTVLSMLKSEGLLRYFNRMMWEATFSTPRLPHWTDDEHFEACLKWADEHSKIAREKGGDFHDQVAAFHKGKSFGGSGPVDAYIEWYRENVQGTIAVEQVVWTPRYGGRLDHLCQLRDGRIALTDTKTQDISKRNKFTFYPEFAIQLGSYSGAVNQTPGLGQVDCIISICVSSNPPYVVQAHSWERPIAYYHKLFLGLLEVWCHANNYMCDV